MEKLPEGASPQNYQELECGWTKIGLQIRCRKHNLNIIHIDFEGQQHPANTNAEQH